MPSTKKASSGSKNRGSDSPKKTSLATLCRQSGGTWQDGKCVCELPLVPAENHLVCVNLKPGPRTLSVAIYRGPCDDTRKGKFIRVPLSEDVSAALIRSLKP